MKNRLLSFILILALCLSLVPAAYAEDGEELLLLPEEDEAELLLLPEEDEAELQLLPAEDEAEEIEEAAAPELIAAGETGTLKDRIEAVRAFSAEPETDETESALPNAYASGQAGNNVTWELSYDGALTIKGKGDMYDYSTKSLPGYYDYRGRIKSVTVLSGVTSIGAYAFLGLVNATSITVGDSVTVLNEGAFSACTNLKTVKLGYSIQTIHAGAFMVCPALTSLTLPASVTSIEDGAFLECEQLAAVNVNSGNQTYKSSSGVLFTKEGKTLLFFPFAKAGDYTVPGSVATIHAAAFTDCTQLTGINLGSVTTIEALAFTGCTQLTKVNIPASVTSLGLCAFCDNAALAEFTVDANNSTYKSLNGVIFSKDGKTIFFFPTAKSGSYAIPNGVIAIADCAFMLCPKLSGVTIPNSVTTIGALAFSGDNGIKSVTIPDSVTTLGDGVFTECRNLNSAVIGSGVRVLSPQTFYNCSGLKTVTLPEGLFGIGYEAFYECSWLESISFPKNLQAIGDGAFVHCAKLTSIEIPDSVQYFGEASFAQCALLTSIKFPAGITEIPAKCFNQCTALKEITIPDSVTRIGDYAFQKCSVLAAVNLGSGLKELGEGVFADCAKIVDIVLPDGLTTIGKCAFMSCSKLVSVTIPDTVTSIGISAFVRCSSLAAVQVPDSVTSLGASAFSDCSSLQEVQLGSGLTVLERSTFNYCTRLRYIRIPENIRKLDYSVFFNCSSMDAVVFLGTPPEFDESAFFSCTTTAYYYEGKGWQEEHFQNYGGHVTWMPYEDLTDAPELTEAFNSATGVRVSWKPVDGAAKYQLLRKNLTKNETEWTVVGETTECSLIDKTTASASRYTFTVRAVDAIGVPGPCDEEGRTCTFIAKADITNITVTEEGVSLQWSKPAGAKNFRVMRRVDGVAKWTVLDVVLGNEYVDTTAEKGVKYWYTVRGVSMDNKVVINSYNGTGWSMKPLETPVLTEAFNSATGVRVSWNAVDGAKNYYLLRMNLTKEETEWRIVGSTTECTFIDTSAASASRYTYTVVCVDSNNRYCSAQGAPRTCTYIAMAKITEIKGVDNGVSLTWSKPAGAKNFRVFRKVDGENTWTALTDVQGTTYTDTTAEKGVKYWYTVRAITMDGKMYINSYNSYGWSVTRK